MDSGTGRRAWATFGIVALTAVAGIVLPGSGCERPSRTGRTTLYEPGDTLRVRMTGHDFQWYVRYAGTDGMFDTDDDRHTIRDVHAPSGVPVVLHLESRDYVYTMALPHLSLKEIAVPDLHFELRFDSGDVGDYELKGDQMCGYSHAELMGTLTVERTTAFTKWLAGLPRGREAAP